MSEIKLPPHGPQNSEYSLSPQEMAVLTTFFEVTVPVQFPSDAEPPGAVEQAEELSLRALGLMSALNSVPDSRKGTQLAYSATALGMARTAPAKQNSYSFLVAKNLLNPVELKALSDHDHEMTKLQTLSAHNPELATYKFLNLTGKLLENANLRIENGESTEGFLLSVLALSAAGAPELRQQQQLVGDLRNLFELDQ